MSKRKKTGDIKVYVEENYFRHVDQMERWRQEYEHHQAVEKKLASVSTLTFELFDYDPLLVRIPWKERPTPNFDYLLEEARLTAESKFFIPIAVRIVALIVMLFILFISSKVYALWISGTLAFTIGVSLYVALNDRRFTIESVLTKTRAEVEERQELEKQKNEQARHEHETQEEARIEFVSKLLEGDISAIMLRLDNVLEKMELSFPLEIDIDVYENTPLIKVWLPPKTIIPTQKSTLLPSGRLAYEEKEQRTINKQYIELCAAVLTRVAAKVYENIPSFGCGYVWGMGKGYLKSECLVSIVTDSEKVALACQAPTGLAALQKMDAKFEPDGMLALQPMETVNPEGWADIPPQLIHGIHVKIFK
ncbi:hypothetical protein SDC9_27523 [bioreactor metagenome]|uniref:Uncharacterized protein n=1 Tax=bioreactor metagenome TaxID=1076179 RepID=A0A644USA4_9ZZZZ|nr:hypothetical protein [Negativicutes bacterium]